MPIYNAQILAVDAKETRRYAGLYRAKNFGEKNIQDACAEALMLIDVRGVWNVFDYNELNDLLVGNSIVKHLEGCKKIICMAATVGAEITHEVNKKFERGEYLASVLLDAAATAAVEQAADSMEKHFSMTFGKDGYKLRSRFSPGYGDWNLTAQEILFKISGAEQIGMTLTSALMLEPRKSITAVIGLAKNSSHKKDCAACDKLDCPMRR